MLLKAEAARFSGCEFLPAVAVALPVLGRLRVPRMVAPPLTSKVEAGVAVLIPIFAALPVPDWNSTELMMSELESHSGRKFTVPVPVTAPEGGGALWPVVYSELYAETAAFCGPARTNADGGNPPTVAASPAFKA